MADPTSERFQVSKILEMFINILGPEKRFYWLAMVYGVGISLLSLATPISVQMLINTVANTALTAPLVVLSLTLFLLLMASGLLNALRIHLMEIFGRKFYARFVSEIALRAIYARNPFFQDERRGPLFNRYFDIIIVQKMMPALLIGGFTLLLQAGVGFVLVSFYHPLFLAFNAVVILLLWATWLIWGREAIRTVVDQSHEKHEAAAWLQSLAASNGFFKTKRHVDYALDRTDEATRGYIEAHRAHFRQHFAQTLSFLTIYALASAALLGLGGWLVIHGELSLGQLVAAELVLSAVFFGISQLGGYMVYFYDLCAAVEELSRFISVELEDLSGHDVFECQDCSLAFVEVRGESRGGPACFNFEIESGSIVMAASERHGLQRLLGRLIKRHEEPSSGYIALGGVDIEEGAISALHQQIIVLDRPTVIEMSIREYLRLSSETVSPSKMLEVLRVVGLEPLIGRLDDGLDTTMSANGWPLSITETMLLKLAAAILAGPRVLILNQLYDLVSEDVLTRAFDYLRSDVTKTVIYFSRRRRNVGCDRFLYLEPERQQVFTSFEEFLQAAYGEADAGPAQPAIGADKPVALIGKS